MKNRLFYLLAVTALTACASNPKAGTNNLVSVTNGEKGAIIASYGGKTACRGLSLKFANVDTGKLFSSKGLNADWMKSVENAQKKISVITVPPGKYKYAGGSCTKPTGRNSTVTIDFLGVTQWFEPFEVKAGEAAYPGTLIAENISHKVDGVMDIVPEFIMRAPTVDYQVFAQEDRTEQVRGRLSEDAPELSGKFLTRLAKPRLNTVTVKQILADSYAYEGKKKGPDARVASRKARRALAKYMLSGTYIPTE